MYLTDLTGQQFNVIEKSEKKYKQRTMVSIDCTGVIGITGLRIPQTTFRPSMA